MVTVRIHRAWKVEAGKAALTLGKGRIGQAAVVAEERQIREGGDHERDEAGSIPHSTPPVTVVLAPLSGPVLAYHTAVHAHKQKVLK